MQEETLTSFLCKKVSLGAVQSLEGVVVVASARQLRLYGHQPSRPPLQVETLERLAAQQQRGSGPSDLASSSDQQPAKPGAGAAPKVTCADVVQLNTAAFANPPTARRLYDDQFVDISLRVLLAKALAAAPPSTLADKFLQSMATSNTGSASAVAMKTAIALRQFELAQIFTKLNVPKEKVQAIFDGHEIPQAFD